MQQPAEQQAPRDGRHVLPAEQGDVIDAEGAAQPLPGHQVRDDRDGGRALHRDGAAHHTAAGGEGPEAGNQATGRGPQAPDRQGAGEDIGPAAPVGNPGHGDAEQKVDRRIGGPHQQRELAVRHVGGVLDRLHQERDEPVVELAAKGHQRDHDHRVPGDWRGQPCSRARDGLRRRRIENVFQSLL